MTPIVGQPYRLIIIWFHVILVASTAAKFPSAFLVVTPRHHHARHEHDGSQGRNYPSLQQTADLKCIRLPSISTGGHRCSRGRHSMAHTHLYNDNHHPIPSPDNPATNTIIPNNNNNTSNNTFNTTTIANHAFRLPTPSDLQTIQNRQLRHPLRPAQVFGVPSAPCKHGHPQAFGFHPTKGPKLVSGLFRLSCPLLCEAIDDYENNDGGVRQMSDWLRVKDRDDDDAGNGEGWKREGYEAANEMQKRIRTELVDDGDDRDKLVDRMGEYNANKFMESGVAGIPASQTYNVKCVHAHVADHLCRQPSSSFPNNADDDDAETNQTGGNIVGEHALKILEERGVEIRGNDVCWQQCDCSRESRPEDWNYVPKKNRQKLRSTRLRRTEGKS